MVTQATFGARRPILNTEPLLPSLEIEARLASRVTRHGVARLPSLPLASPPVCHPPMRFPLPKQSPPPPARLPCPPIPTPCSLQAPILPTSTHPRTRCCAPWTEAMRPFGRALSVASSTSRPPSAPRSSAWTARALPTQANTSISSNSRRFSGRRLDDLLAVVAALPLCYPLRSSLVSIPSSDLQRFFISCPLCAGARFRDGTWTRPFGGGGISRVLSKGNVRCAAPVFLIRRLQQCHPAPGRRSRNALIGP